jgi:hypothetical protein
MRIIAYDRFKPGVTLDTIKPLLPEEFDPSIDVGGPYDRTAAAVAAT